jgi:hypothetical protein
MPVDTGRLQALFDAVASDGYTSARAIQDCISECGLSIDDHRLRATKAITSPLEDIVGSPIEVFELQSLAQDRHAQAMASAVSPFDELLARLAEALAIHAGVLQLEIDRFQRRLAGR